MVDDADRAHLRRCVELTRAALDAGDATQHPGFRARPHRLRELRRATSRWHAGLGAPPAPVRPLPIPEVAPGLVVDVPVAGLDAEVRELHRRFLSG